jgi:hypothetical protein
MGYKLRGKVKTKEVDGKINISTDFFILGIKSIYRASITTDEDKVICTIIDKETEKEVYTNDKITKCDKSSLTRCIAIFSKCFKLVN